MWTVPAFENVSFNVRRAPSPTRIVPLFTYAPVDPASGPPLSNSARPVTSRNDCEPRNSGLPCSRNRVGAVASPDPAISSPPSIVAAASCPSLPIVVGRSIVSPAAVATMPASFALLNRVVPCRCSVLPAPNVSVPLIVTFDSVPLPVTEPERMVSSVLASTPRIANEPPFTSTPRTAPSTAPGTTSSTAPPFTVTVPTVVVPLNASALPAESTTSSNELGTPAGTQLDATSHCCTPPTEARVFVVMLRSTTRRGEARLAPRVWVFCSPGS